MVEPSFLELVQLHERKWGDRAYPGRPSLSEIISAEFVIVWKVQYVYIFSVHRALPEINSLIERYLRNGTNKRLLKVFYRHQEMQWLINLSLETTQQTQPMTIIQPEEEKPRPVQSRPVLPGRNAPMLPGRKAIILAQIPERLKRQTSK